MASDRPEKRARDAGSGKDAYEREAKRERRIEPEECPAPSISEIEVLPGFPDASKQQASEEVTALIEGYFDKMKANSDSIVKQLRQRRDFSHPDTLPNIIKKCGIDEFGSFLAPSVWCLPGDNNPNGLRKEDYFQEIMKVTEAKKPAPNNGVAPAASVIQRKSGVASRPAPAGSAPPATLPAVSVVNPLLAAQAGFTRK